MPEVTTVPVEHLEGDDGALIILLDFAFASEGVLRDIVGGADRACRLIRLDPVTALAGAREIPSLPGLAAAYVQAVLEAYGQPSVLAGYCGTARLTLEVAAQLERQTGCRPHVVLVEPSWIDDALVLDALAEARERLGCADPYALDGVSVELQELLSVLARDIRELLQADGVPDAEVADTSELLLERYRSYFGFLLATLHATIEDGWEPRTATCRCAGARDLILQLAGAVSER